MPCKIGFYASTPASAAAGIMCLGFLSVQLLWNMIHQKPLEGVSLHLAQTYIWCIGWTWIWSWKVKVTVTSQNRIFGHNCRIHALFMTKYSISFLYLYIFFFTTYVIWVWTDMNVNYNWTGWQRHATRRELFWLKVDCERVVVAQRPLDCFLSPVSHLGYRF